MSEYDDVAKSLMVGSHARGKTMENPWRWTTRLASWGGSSGIARPSGLPKFGDVTNGHEKNKTIGQMMTMWTSTFTSRRRFGRPFSWPLTGTSNSGSNGLPGLMAISPTART